MRTLRIVSFALALAVVAGIAASRPASAAVSFDFFYSNLSHQGSWLVSGSYGRVWRPAVYHAGWNPYYDGHWVYTDAGWCWDSDYAWGDIPYHYGTWVMDGAYGWVWVPGYTWAPSWVEFRQGPDYIGWAPVAPSFSIGVSFHGGYPLPSSFVFVRSHDFLCDRVRAYAVPRTQVNVIVNRTTIINNNIRIENNVVVNRGPDVRYVERATRRRVEVIPVARTRSVRELGARGVSGTDLRVSGRGNGRGLRAAEPVSATRPLPAGRDGVRSDRFNSRAPERRQAPAPRAVPERRQAPAPRAVPERRQAPAPRAVPERRQAPDPRGSKGQHASAVGARPDEGRMFRGVRESQPSRRADPAPQKQERSRSSGHDSKVHKDRKVHEGHDGRGGQ